MTETDNLKNKAISGASWKMVERISGQFIHFFIGIMMARILSPEDYGIVGMLTIFFALAGTFQDSGFGSALIQKKNRTDDDFSTVFIFNVGSSIVIYSILFFTAPLIADFYNTPILTNITRVSALSFIIGGLTGIQYSKLNIELKFKTKSLLSILGQIITGIVGLILAYNGMGVWALVLQGLASSVVTGTVIWIISGWKPSLRFSRTSFNSLFKFGSNILGSNIINVLYNNMYTLVIGKVFNPLSVGLFTRANSYASLPAGLVSSMAINVNYPILAKIQDDDERLLRAYTKLLTVPFYILYPILIGMVVCAEPLISVMIGDKWLPCVPYLQILCFGYMFYPLNGFNMNLLYVKGRSDLALKMDFIKKPIGLALLACSIPFGIIWMMVGKALYSILVYFMNCYYTNKFLGFGIKAQTTILMPIMFSSFIMGIMVFVTIHFIEPNWVKLLIGIPEGIIMYILWSKILKVDSYYEIKDIIKNQISKK